MIVILNHFKDLLKDKENIIVSYNFIYKTLISVGIYSPKIRKRASKIRKFQIIYYGLRYALLKEVLIFAKLMP